MLCASFSNLAFVCGWVTFARYSYGGWCLGSRRRSWRLPDEAHLGLGWWPVISEAEDPVGQELGVVGSPGNYAAHDRPQQQGSAHPAAKRFTFLNLNNQF